MALRLDWELLGVLEGEVTRRPSVPLFNRRPCSCKTVLAIEHMELWPVNSAGSFSLYIRQSALSIITGPLSSRSGPVSQSRNHCGSLVL